MSFVKIGDSIHLNEDKSAEHASFLLVTCVRVEPLIGRASEKSAFLADVLHLRRIVGSNTGC
jgi:hypothetical protein